jgi:hypothetical protein
MARLTDGRVLAEIEGGFQELGKFSGNEQHCISVDFQPVTARKIRIAVDKLNPALPDLRVLSEIEVYGKYIQ